MGLSEEQAKQEWQVAGTATAAARRWQGRTAAAAAAATARPWQRRQRWERRPVAEWLGGQGRSCRVVTRTAGATAAWMGGGNKDGQAAAMGERGSNERARTGERGSSVVVARR